MIQHLYGVEQVSISYGRRQLWWSGGVQLLKKSADFYITRGCQLKRYGIAGNVFICFLEKQEK